MYGFVVVFIHLCSVAGEVSARGIERVWPLIKDDIKHKVMDPIILYHQLGLTSSPTNNISLWDLLEIKHD